MSSDRQPQTASKGKAADAAGSVQGGPQSPASPDGRSPPGEPLPKTRINPRAEAKANAVKAATEQAKALPLDLATLDYIGARAQQQDSTAAHWLKNQSGAILILADGLGGHESGQEASQIVRDTFVEACEAGKFDTIEARYGSLREALELSNSRIAGGVDPAHGQRSMASTAVAAVVANGVLQWISVGDSHLYIWREGRMYKLNEDHSQAGLMVRSGQYKPTDPEVLAAKSVLVSALTGRRLEIIDHPKTIYKIEKGDVLLLASDGLNTLDDHEIEAIVTNVQSQGAQLLGETLLKAVIAKRADRQDNATVAIARVLDIPAETSNVVPADLSEITNSSVTSPKIHPESAAERTEATPPPPVVPDAGDRTIPHRRPQSSVSPGRRFATNLVTSLIVLIALALVGLVGYGLSSEKGFETTRTEIYNSVLSWLGLSSSESTIREAAPKEVAAPPKDAAAPRAGDAVNKETATQPEAPKSPPPTVSNAPPVPGFPEPKEAPKLKEGIKQVSPPAPAPAKQQ